MSETVINLKGINADKSQIEILKAKLHDTAGSDGCSVVVADSFNGVQDIVIILTAAGGGVVITEVAKTVRAWLQRNDNIRIEVGNISVEGVDADKAVEIIEKCTEESKDVSGGKADESND